MALAVGLMSGTSLDGIDAALVEIQGSGINTKCHLIKGITKVFSEPLKEKIKNSISLDKSNVRLICSLNFELGYIFADAVKEVCKEANISVDRLDFVASHGQTIWHNPMNDNSFHSSTLQIGESAVIAYETNTLVVSNFRVMDIAAGGQGAPLVPYVDYILHSNKNESIIIQNIGGIGNLTYLKKGGYLEDVVAFDTGPGNMMIDYIMKKYFNKEYDDSGKIASKGKIIEWLLKDLKNHDFIKKIPPKSTGREDFGEEFIENVLKKVDLNVYSYDDLVTTFTHFTAFSIIYHYQEIIKTFDKVIIAGGGSYNKYLINLIKQELKCEVFTYDEIGFDSNYKEAIAFAILGNETINNIESNVLGATGANRKVVLGNLTPRPYKV